MHGSNVRPPVHKTGALPTKLIGRRTPYRLRSACQPLYDAVMARERMISVRFSDPEYTDACNAAVREGKPLAEYVRASAVDRARVSRVAPIRAVVAEAEEPNA